MPSRAPPTLLLLAVAVCAVGCVPDDWDGHAYGADTGAPATADPAPDTEPDPLTAGTALDGQWLSEGDDLSPLFASALFDYERVEASFGPGDAYVTVVTDGTGAEARLSGTFTADPPSDGPAVVTLHQVQPYEAEAVGIFQLTEGAPDRLQWEIVQVDPDYGYTPPTPATGFGSTSGPGLTPGANVQAYARVAR